MSFFLHRQDSNTKALVTLAIGQKYQDLFSRYAKENFLAYCKKFEYDLICVTDVLDQSERAQKRNPAWQKLLILSQPWSKNYTQVLWMDTDIIININNAKDIAEGVPLNKIGAVDQYAIPTKEIYQIAFQRYYNSRYGEIPAVNNLSPRSYYQNHGLTGGDALTEVVQTGVWLASPLHHKDVLEKIYYGYEDVNDGISRDQYEMPAMSLELIRGQHVHWIQYQFNFDVICHLFAYYPHLILAAANQAASSNDQAVQGREHGSLEQQLISSLNVLYQLSIFMHFNGCHQIMIDYSDHIER